MAGAEMVEVLLSSGPGIQKEALSFKGGKCQKMPEILAGHGC